VTRWLPVRFLSLVVALTAAWCALWGEVTAANVASGLIVSSFLAVLGGRLDGSHRPAVLDGGVRFGPLLRLLALIGADLVASTVAVAREVLTRTDHTDEAIVTVELPPGSERHLLLLVVGITVTPGTAVVDTMADGSALSLHLLHRDGMDRVVARARLLAELADRAFPAPRAVAEEVGR
jgi:multicomponent Na+:H+ antiporter subunit E